MLLEEMDMVDKKTVEDVMNKWKTRRINLTIERFRVYHKLDKKKGWIQLFALDVASEDILDLREDLGLPRKPSKFTTHITLLEKSL